MDARTTSVLDALAHPGGALLLVLCEGPATEAALLSAVPSATQATANRRLAELERAGIIARDAGKAKAPGRAWRVCEPSPTESLLRAALELSDVLAAADERRRQQAMRQLRKARATRLGIRKAGGR